MKTQSNHFGFYKKIFLVILLLVSGCSYRCSRMESVRESVHESEISESRFDVIKEESETTRTMIWVHIAGAVKHPGVYQLKDGSRVMEGIEACGGFSEEADRDFLNLAEPMSDAQKIYVPKIGEDLTQIRMNAGEFADSPDSRANGGVNDDSVAHSQFSGKVDINHADKSELTTLPGIGEKKAEDIIRYRTDFGKFQSVEEIMQVPGIKENAFRKIKDKIVAN